MTTESEAPCNCRDWAENIPYLDDMLLLRWLHGGKQYEGKPFVYCPWCGTRLTSLAKLARNASGIGWGYGDYVREQIETVQEQFGDI
jgi:hypothetical protein